MYKYKYKYIYIRFMCFTVLMFIFSKVTVCFILHFASSL